MAWTIVCVGDLRKCVLVVYLLSTWMTLADAADHNIMLHLDAQKSLLVKAELQCYGHILSLPRVIKDVYCNRTWDNLLCWNDTLPGTLAVQKCPPYVNGFHTDATASRYCTTNGSWLVHPTFNTTWTNFSTCLSPIVADSAEGVPEIPAIIQDNMPNLRLMYNIGYGLSLASLVGAVIIMLCFRRLHCPRNTIHLNLFTTFILKAAISLAREYAFVEGLGFASDVSYDENGDINFSEEGTHWPCRLFFTVFHYVIALNYTWIFIEGLFLHMLIFVSVFTEKTSVKWYMLVGWVSPLTFIIPWVVVRAVVDNKYCWNTHPTPEFYWIIKAPIVASIVINFIFFVNIVRVLFTKLNASACPETKKFRYRRLAKSTLVLIPLFGVYYIVFVHITYPTKLEPLIDVVLLYIEMFCNSYQGLLLALLFCFLNTEVQTEIKKVWRRRRYRSGSHCSASHPLSGSRPRHSREKKYSQVSHASYDAHSHTPECLSMCDLSHPSLIKEEEIPFTNNVQDSSLDKIITENNTVTTIDIEKVSCLNNNHGHIDCPQVDSDQTVDSHKGRR